MYSLVAWELAKTVERKQSQQIPSTSSNSTTQPPIWTDFKCGGLA